MKRIIIDEILSTCIVDVVEYTLTGPLSQIPEIRQGIAEQLSRLKYLGRQVGIAEGAIRSKSGLFNIIVF